MWPHVNLGATVRDPVDWPSGSGTSAAVCRQGMQLSDCSALQVWTLFTLFLKSRVTKSAATLVLVSNER